MHAGPAGQIAFRSDIPRDLRSSNDNQMDQAAATEVKTQHRAKPRWKSRLGAVGAGFIVFATILLAVHDVPTEPTTEDVHYSATLLSSFGDASHGFDSHGDFEAEVSFIGAVQRAVQAAAPVSRGIPYGQRRELKNVLEAGYGSCYDRSRAIEQVLRSNGFRVRHVFILYLRDGRNPLVAAVTPGNPSHAVSEVKTARGWLVVDSNRSVLSLKMDGSPGSIRELARWAAGDVEIRWQDHETLEDLYLSPFIPIYGLYSRHGEFYPPFNAIPDVNWRGLWQNF